MVAGTRGPDAGRSYGIAVACLLGLALVLVAYPAIRIAWDIEIDANEGWNAYYQLRAIAGQSLYHNDSPLFMNNYPPLSFYVVGAVAALVGDPQIAGRLVSLVSLLVVALSCGSIVRSAGGQRTDATLAIATCLGLFSVFATDYLGMNDPQMLGQALIAAGLAVHMRGPQSARRGILIAVLFGLGVLTKHNMVIVPLLVAADILRRGSNPVRISFFATGLTMAALSALLLLALVGETFFTQLLMSRAYDPARGFLVTTEVLGKLQAPLAIIGLLLLSGRHQRPIGLLGAYMALALVEGAVFAGGQNTDINVFFDLYIALAIGTGLASHCLELRMPAAGLRTGLALVANAGVLFGAPLALGRFVVDVAGDMTDRERLFHADVDYVKAHPGPVLCQSYLLCFRAGKPMIYDTFNVNMNVAHGRLPADILTAKLRRHEFSVIQISDLPEHSPNDPPGAQSMPARFTHFSDEVFAVLDQEYVVDRVGNSGRFYRPR
jgi:Dolichyl-phosphate-mannose-protein mannosyltransferase